MASARWVNSVSSTPIAVVRATDQVMVPGSRSWASQAAVTRSFWVTKSAIGANGRLNPSA